MIEDCVAVLHKAIMGKPDLLRLAGVAGDVAAVDAYHDDIVCFCAIPMMSSRWPEVIRPLR